MNPAGTLGRLSQSSSAFWSARNARERKMLVAATAVIVMGLIYVLLIAPAVNGREQLNKNLPAMRQQVAELQAMSKEVAGMTATSAPSVAPISKESVEAALMRKGLKPQTVAVTGDIARIQLSEASFGGLLDWLDDMQKTALLSVVDASIVALPQSDMVNATLMLRQQKSE